MKQIQPGSGASLLLVHGALADATMWAEHRQYLQPDFEVITTTLRHFGEADTGSFGLNSHARDLANLIAELDTKKPLYLAGWSYGADVLLNTLIRHNPHVSGVFLYEPGFPGCLEEPVMSDWQADAEAMFGAVFDHFSQGNLAMAVEALIDGSGQERGYFNRQSAAARKLQLSKAATLKHQLNQQEQPDINRANIAAIPVPVTIGYGSNTRTLFRLASTSTIGLSDLIDVRQINGEGHMFPMESPERFSALIKSLFVDAHSQVPG
ncbi:alpha/beta fold hydrolase [Parahaliea mediterranea]|uniref:Alpha/beta hydrolase n=1 Tax=Parahaliea mediterranea TaxID=651086 RepID=A0A939DD78_9GAMM|nr:alpha/beta hydrolase [Parahaliea mediterranea]MBN7795894.1 alpha/beta hydrolase [Parahaliea mediterranea]